MSEHSVVDRLKRLQEQLAEVCAEMAELRQAATEREHRLNQWPHRERRAASRSTGREASGS